MLLKDKVCVVVGSASLRSIGYATAELFACHGAKIAVADIMMDDAAAAAISLSIGNTTQREPELFGVKCDLRSYEQCGRLARQVIERYGTIDCLVNCAAVVKSQPLLQIEEPDFDRIMDVNLKGTFNICKSALNVFAARKQGVIVNLSSVAAERGGGLVGGAHYAASKGGVISLTRAIAREFGPLGIRANVICPSMTETSMLDDTVTPEMFRQVVSAIPLQRAGRPSDIAGACLFLASDLSAYVTGATLDVNGGSHIH